MTFDEEIEEMLSYNKDKDWKETWSNQLLECALNFAVISEEYEKAQEIRKFLDNRVGDIEIPKGQMMPWFGDEVPEGWERVWIQDMMTNFEVTTDMWYSKQYITYKKDEYHQELIDKWKENE